jgi:hypothetical protein
MFRVFGVLSRTSVRVLPSCGEVLNSKEFAQRIYIFFTVYIDSSVVLYFSSRWVFVFVWGTLSNALLTNGTICFCLIADAIL